MFIPLVYTVPLIFIFNRLAGFCNDKYEITTSAFFFAIDKLIYATYSKERMQYIEAFGGKPFPITLQLFVHNAYYINDLMSNKNSSLSMKMHHILAVIGSLMYFSIHNGSIITQVFTLNAMSTSAFFLDLYRLTSKTNQSLHVQMTVFLIFAATFSYYRIYSMWFIIEEFSRNGANQTVALLLYLVYLLNWYWLFAIFQKAVKKLNNRLAEPVHQ
jgi:hypothetical protein